MSEEIIVRPPSYADSRRPAGPTLFLPSFAEPEPHADLDAVALRIQELAAAASGSGSPDGDPAERQAKTLPLSFCAGVFAYDGFDTLPSVTAYGGGRWLATVYLPGVTAPTAKEALARACGVFLEDAA